MKKVFSAVAAVALLLVVFSSCGEKLLSQEEMNQRIEAGVQEVKDSLITVWDQECLDQMDMLVAQQRDSLLNALEAQDLQ